MSKDDFQQQNVLNVTPVPPITLGIFHTYCNLYAVNKRELAERLEFSSPSVFSQWKKLGKIPGASQAKLRQFFKEEGIKLEDLAFHEDDGLELRSHCFSYVWKNAVELGLLPEQTKHLQPEQFASMTEKTEALYDRMQELRADKEFWAGLTYVMHRLLHNADTSSYGVQKIADRAPSDKSH